jgi:hypothetical protein
LRKGGECSYVVKTTGHGIMTTMETMAQVWEKILRGAISSFLTLIGLVARVQLVGPS